MTPASKANGATQAPQEPAGGRANGTPTSTPTLPVDSYREAAPLLRRPFTPQAVKFKVQATWPKDNPTGALIVAYIDARLAIERLNLVCPHLWQAPAYTDTRHGLMCTLTVDGLSRSDVGEGQGKTAHSDALKRAAVHFGIGVSLYATPKIILNLDANGLVKSKRTSKGPTLELTDAGEARCRQLYTRWLDEHGRAAFGEPLDHGDAPEGSIGDAEVDVPEPEAPAPPPVQATPPAEPQEDPEQALAAVLAEEGPLQSKRRAANKGMEALGAKPHQRLRELRTAGDDEKALNALIVRLDNALDGGGTK